MHRQLHRTITALEHTICDALYDKVEDVPAQQYVAWRLNGPLLDMRLGWSRFVGWGR